MPAQEKIQRNDPCPCGSGKKYKQCCLKKEGPKRSFKAKVLSNRPNPSRSEDEPMAPPLEQKVDLMDRAFGKALQQMKEPFIAREDGEAGESDLKGKISKKSE